jgi:TolB-like protein/predicted Zn-dependent protease
VLPLKNLGTEADSDYFVDGLTDEIIRNLAVIDGLEVRSRTSSFAFKDKPRNLADVGAQLGVNLVVEGSVLRSGNRLRVNAQLVRVAGDVPLWSDRFERELEDVFAIQDDISRAIVNRLRLTLGRGQRRYDTGFETYELYLKARELVARKDTANAQKGAELFDQVIARDPSFAPAFAGLADAWAFMSMDIAGGVPFETALARMRPAAAKALELDPLLAEAHAAMGLVYSRERDWQNAQASFMRAIELNPSLTHIYTNYTLSTLIPLGRLEEAEKRAQAVLRTDPLSLDAQRNLAALQIFLGRYEEAIRNLQRIKLVEPDFTWVDIFLTRALALAGRPAEALRVLEPQKHLPGANYWMAHAYVLDGRRAEAERLAAVHDHPYRLAFIYAALGDKDRALEALDRAADVVPHRVSLLLLYPELAPLRGDPRFAAIRRKLGLP